MMALRWLAAIVDHFEALHARLILKRLQSLGMHIGKDVVLPPSTTVDVEHCYLIAIGDRCHFGPQCLILAHDAQMDEFLDAGRMGRVVIGADCRIGARSVILCNVEIGAGTIVEVGSVVASSLPAASYCAGSPARVVCSAEEYARRVAKDVAGRPRHTEEAIRESLRRPEGREALWDEATTGSVVVVGKNGADGVAVGPHASTR